MEFDFADSKWLLAMSATKSDVNKAKCAKYYESKKQKARANDIKVEQLSNICHALGQRMGVSYQHL
jgi:hypothetical protein